MLLIQMPAAGGGAVSSVAGRTGAVTLSQADISGLTTASSPTFAGLTLTNPLTIGNGGTGAATAGAARTALGLAIGTDVLAPNGSGANLTGIASSVAGRTGAVTLAQADISGLTTASSPTFAGLTLGAVTFTEASGALTIAAGGSNKSVTLTPSGTGGVTITSGNLLVGTSSDSSNGRLQLATHTANTGGIGWGTDTTLYRSAAGTLNLDHSAGNSPIFYLRESGSIKGFITTQSGDCWVGAQTGQLLLKSNNTTAATFDTSQNVTFVGKVIAGTAFIGRAVQTAGFSAGTMTVDWSTGNTFKLTLSANVTTTTFSNMTDGQTIIVALTNTASNYTVAWPTVVWSGGAAPTMTIGAKTDVYTFVRLGSTTYGSVVQNMS